MKSAELVFALALVVFLLAAGGYYAWRQVKLLRKLRFSTESPEDRRFLRGQAIRRLISSALIVLFAILLAGSYAFESLLPHGDATADEDPLRYAFLFYWIGIFLLFLVIVCLATFDLLATRRFTFRQLRQLQEQHDALIAQQAARVRGHRNGRM